MARTETYATVAVTKGRPFLRGFVTEDPTSTLTDYLEDRSGESDETASGESTETGGDETAESEETSEAENDAGPDGENGSVGTDAEPAVTTYAWGSYVCAACGTSVERVWQRGTEDDDSGSNATADDLVCESCKTW